MNDEIMTVTQAAEYLKISKIQMFRFLKREVNPIPFVKIGKKTRRIYKKELVEWTETVCPNCQYRMYPELENNGFTEPEGESHWEATGKLKCPNCGHIK